MGKRAGYHGILYPGFGQGRHEKYQAMKEGTRRISSCPLIKKWEIMLLAHENFGSPWRGAWCLIGDIV